MKLAMLIGLAALVLIPTLSCLFVVAVSMGRRDRWRLDDSIDHGDSSELTTGCDTCGDLDCCDASEADTVEFYVPADYRGIDANRDYWERLRGRETND